MSDEEVLFRYGKDAVISRKGAFVLVHLDRPAPGLVRSRTDAFDPDDFFCADCGMCQMLKEGGVVIFDDSVFEDDATVGD